MSKEAFPDKKRSLSGYDESVDWLETFQQRQKEVEPAQEFATWNIWGEYPTVPVGVTFTTDVHFGAVGMDTKLFNKQVNTVVKTPNMFMVMGGDLIDAFAPTKHPTGMSSDAMPPDQQAEAMIELVTQLDQWGKLGAVQVGNHDKWSDIAGYQFHRFLRELQCPVFSGAGEMDWNINGGATIPIFWSHTHWGTSKLNITNAGKRALQFTSPRSQIALLGHTHQASSEVFDIGGVKKGVIVGGTFKQKDGWAASWGMIRPGKPGYTLLMWPDGNWEIVRKPETAQKFILGEIAKTTADPEWVDPYTRSKNGGKIK